MKKIIPCLWFDNNAEEAVKYYTSIIKNSKIGTIARYGEAGSNASGKPKGTVMTVSFELNGQEFLALNGGPQFKFNESISFVLNCETQKEIDELWEKLTRDGEEGPCGWLKDKFGMSWQVVPSVLQEMIKDKDAGKSERMMKALIQMKKLDMKKLKEAFDQK
jgi:predicted 3-demethylubiquinone-9 3-methyltransferase (glyoxalase superfamily)